MEPNPLADLSARELEALRAAAVWYAKYHAHTVAEEAGNEAAYAASDREKYLNLIAALRKLGVQIRPPDEIAGLERRVAA